MSDPGTAPGDALVADPRRWKALVVLAVVQGLFVLDLTVVNVSLPTIGRELGLGEVGLVWVVNGYALMAGGLLLLGGRLGDVLGRRKLFLIGVTVFTISSFVAGIAWQPWMLVAARFAQGVGDALAAPAVFGIVATTFHDPGERATALGVLASLSGVGGTLGIALSGVLNEFTSWRWVFLVNIPIGVVAILLSLRLVSGRLPVPGAGSTDKWGALTLTGGTLALVYGILQAGEEPWTGVPVAGPLLLAFVLLVLFIVVERRSRNPLFPLSFFRNRMRVTACGASLLFGSGFFSMFFLLTLFVREALGWTALETGLGYLPYGVMIVVGAVVSGQLVPRLGARTVLVSGCAITAVGFVLLGVLMGSAGTPTYLSAFLPATLVVGLGAGLSLPTLTVGALHEVSEDNAGLASGVQTSATQIGAALGTAVLVVVSALAAGPLASGAPDVAAGFRAAMTGSAVAAVLAGLLAAVLLSASVGRREPTQAPA